MSADGIALAQAITGKRHPALVHVRKLEQQHAKLQEKDFHDGYMNCTCPLGKIIQAAYAEAAAEPKWIEFLECLARTKDAKTKIWAVVAKDGGAALGTVKWFGRWRRYAFFPLPTMVFEPTCLRDIADFCETKTKEHTKARAAR